MDLQQWLEFPVWTEDGAGSLPAMPANALINRAASESAAAHYSEYTFRPADHIFKNSSFGASSLFGFLFKTAETTVLLGRHVLAAHGRNL